MATPLTRVVHDEVKYGARVPKGRKLGFYTDAACTSLASLVDSAGAPIANPVTLTDSAAAEVFVATKVSQLWVKSDYRGDLARPVTCVPFGDALTATVAELNLMDDVAASATFTPAAGASNVCEVTIQLKDAAGVNLTHACLITVWLSDAATGVLLTSHAADTLAVKAASGESWQAVVANKCHLIQTKADGSAILQITDTHKTGFYVGASFRNGRPFSVSAQLVAGNYGA